MEVSEVNRKGRKIVVPSVSYNGRTVVIEGKFIKIAHVYDEEWLEGQCVRDPAELVAHLKGKKAKADLLTFGQKLPDTSPAYPFYFDEDNVAAITLETFDQWWLGLPQVTRKNVRRCAKRGVVVRRVELDEELLKGIAAIFNSDPVRQGVPNVHYGKDFNTVREEVSTYADTSEFIGAYFADELIGYIKLVYVGSMASIMNIVAKNAHHDKRPINGLIAKAVEVVCQKGARFVVYGKYHYGNKGHDALAEFKRRNGFTPINLPVYFVPLSWWGKVALALRLQHGPLGFLPRGLINILLQARRRLYTVGLTRKLSSGEELKTDALA